MSPAEALLQHPARVAARALPGWIPALIALGLIGNLLGWVAIGVLPDEAYYWVWSERLQAGYFDHPPLVAVVIRLATALFGDATWAIRLPSVLGWLVGALCAWDLARRLLPDPRAGMVAVLIWSSLPIVQAGFHIVTPDTPLVLFAWLTWHAVARAVREGGAAPWLLTGLWAGLALQGKYPGVLLLGSILFGLLATRGGRRQLATPWPWLGALLALVLFAPVVVWNAQHDWISFAFQFGHGVKRQAEGAPLALLGAFIGAQMGVVMPWTWLAMAAASLPTRAQRERFGPELHALFAAGFWLPLLLFGAAGMTAEGEANWPVLAYLPGTLLLTPILTRWLFPEDGRRRRGRAAAVIGAYLLVVVVLDLVRFPHWLMQAGIQLPPQRTQLSQTYGWEEVAPVLKALMARQQAGRAQPCIAVGDKLQTTAMLGLLLNDPHRVTSASNTRFNQFALWEREAPTARESLCLFFSQFDRRERIPEREDLGRQGVFRLAQVIEHRNPDLSTRFSAFYLPE